MRDSEAIAAIWHRGWHEAHAHLVPAGLTALRTMDSFLERVAAMLPDTVVAGAEAGVYGFCTIREDELYQLFVDPPGRGTGAAALLVADAEVRLAARGVKTAWLSCAIGNDRAGRCYEKCGWQRVGNMINEAVTAAGSYPLETWRYEKQLLVS